MEKKLHVEILDKNQSKDGGEKFGAAYTSFGVPN
jgi:hypothetical protein